jgi:peptide/nickel transport system substrate-binding protein
MNSYFGLFAKNKKGGKMNNRSLIILVVALVMVAMLVLPSCTPAATPSPTSPPQSTTTPKPAAGTPKYGGTLRIGMADEPVVLGQPAVGSLSLDSLAAGPAIEQLRKIDAKGDMYPWLAEEFKPDYNALTVTMTLKKGIKFHDGTDFNAEAVKWNYDWLIEKKTQAVAKVKSVEVVDPYTVKVNLKEWGSDIVYDITGIYVVSPTAWKTNGDDWGRQNPVGTGPFKFESRQREVNIKYVKFNDYWQKGKPYLDRIEFTMIKDPMTRLAAFKAGEIDMSTSPSIAQAQELAKDSKYVVQHSPGCGGSYRLNPDGQNQDSPFANLKVRQAVAYAIDRKALVDGILGGYAAVSYQHFLAGTWPYNPNLKGYPYDPAKAKQLLTEAGYPNGFEMKIIGMNTGIDPAVCTAVQAMLAQVGIKATLDLQSAAAVNTIWAGGWKNALGLSQLPPNPSMVTWLVNFSWKSTRQTSKSLLNTPEIDDLCTQATIDPNPETRKAKVAALMDAMFDKYVQCIPLFITDSLLLKYPYVKDEGMFTKVLSGEWQPEAGWLDR